MLFSRRRQLLEGENFAENRADAQHFVAVLTDAIETIADRFLDALRDQHLLHVTALPAPALTTHRAALDQSFQHFLDEERIAFSFTMDGNGKLTADMFAE